MKEANIFSHGSLSELIKKENIQLVVVGAGLSGSVIAERFTSKNLGKVLMIEQRDHLAGNIHTPKDENGILIHKMGSHIFHTNVDRVFNYLQMFTTFDKYEHKVIANTGEEVVTMPFNIQTMSQIFKTSEVEEIKKLMNIEIENAVVDMNIDPANPLNFEEQAILLIGTSIYYKLIYGYTKKQWGREPKTLPAEIIKRLPIRWNLDLTYFNNAKYQGMPTNGYTKMVENMLNSDDILLLKNEEFVATDITEIPKNVKIIFTGGIDELLNLELGQLEYRTLTFTEETLKIDTFQGCPVVNYTNENVEHTRITEHKFYMPEEKRPKNVTVISTEFASEHIPFKTIPYYPIGDKQNKELHEKYVQLLSSRYPNVIPLGRLATYQYLDMDKTVDLALTCFEENFIN